MNYLSRNSESNTEKEIKNTTGDSISQNSERIVDPTTRNFGKESKQEHVEDGKQNLYNLADRCMRKSKNFEYE